MEQALVNIIIALIAVTGTLTGTKLGNYYTLKSERRKKVRESIEEIFTLNTQIRIWVHVTLRYLYDEISKIDYYRDVIPAEYLEKSGKEPDCPIERLKMLLNLDAPSILVNSIEYIYIVSQLREMKYIYDTHKSEKTLDYYITGVAHHRIGVLFSEDINSASEFLDYASKMFDKFQASLTIELSDLAQKN